MATGPNWLRESQKITYTTNTRPLFIYNCSFPNVFTIVRLLNAFTTTCLPNVNIINSDPDIHISIVYVFTSLQPVP
jgi:hypothetical protein